MAGDLIYSHDEEKKDTKPSEKTVRLVTPEEEKQGSIPITSVVLPLPGVSIEYPTNETKDAYEVR